VYIHEHWYNCNCIIAEWSSRYRERWGAGVEYHFQEFNEPYAPL